MSRKDFYSQISYREKQSRITKLNWAEGKFNFLYKKVNRVCKRPRCAKTFTTLPSDLKRYCSQSCSATANNTGRTLSLSARKKISLSLTGRTYPGRGGPTMKIFTCENNDCQKKFSVEAWRHLKYCSNKCAMLIIGGRPTSPRAARAKAGIRPDIDSKIYFYSRWEANYARILNFLGSKWIHQPKRFRLKSQYYTPDFYLPENKTYVEIKNFLSDYSKKRDMEFRELYPEEKLILILKSDYQELEKKYAPFVKGWEFSK